MAELKTAGIVPGQDVAVRAISRFGEAVPVTAENAGAAEATVAPLIAHAVHLEAHATRAVVEEPLRAELDAMASWLGADRVRFPRRLSPSP